jgi:hypothetical protein
MNRVTEQELMDRLDAARALATKITDLQDAKNKLTKLAASEGIVGVTIESAIAHPVKLQASTSSLTPFEPAEMHCILSLALLVVERKLTELKLAYEEL